MSKNSTDVVVTTLPKDATIRKQIEILVRKVDLEVITTKQFIQLLSAKMGGVDLGPKKAYIKSTLTEVLDAMEEEEEEEDEEEEINDKSKNESKNESKDESKDECDDEYEDEYEVEDEDEDTMESILAREVLAVNKGIDESDDDWDGLTPVVKDISPEMAAFLGTETRLSRREVESGLWKHIEANNLKNPEDKYEIILDDKMKSLFHCDKISLFKLGYYIKSHIHPFTPVQNQEGFKSGFGMGESEDECDDEDDDECDEEYGDEDTMVFQSRNVRNVFLAFCRLEAFIKAADNIESEDDWDDLKDINPEMAAFLGTETRLSRVDVVKGLWAYIQANNLQKPKDNPREIILDDKMKSLFHCDKISVGTFGKYVSSHIHPFTPVQNPEGKVIDESEDECDDEDTKKPLKKARTDLNPL